jgi:hypothetical protein
VAENRNQHFVPRCHFRPFSSDGEGRAINLFNLDLDRTIRNAPLRNQCSGDYFYGRDERLESAVQFIEQGYAKSVRELHQTRSAVTPMHRAVLRRFAYLQHLRTENAARSSYERLQAMCDVPAGPDVPPYKEAMAEAVMAAMVTFAGTMRIVDDLRLVIVRNLTDRPFVTSDSPSVLTNRLYLQKPQTKGRGFGVRNAGAILILPLSPTLCSLLYDSDVYSVPHKRGWVDCGGRRDIEALNEHQVLSCAANLYFGDWNDRERVANAARQARPARPASRYNVIRAVLDSETARGKRYAVKADVELKHGDEILTHIIFNHPRPSNWPSFLRFRTDRKIYSNASGTGFVRAACIEQGFATGGGYRKVSI